MKTIAITVLLTTGAVSYAQTNRINHYSHSGSLATLNIFKANDNMGLGCGSSLNYELTPSIDSTTIIWDSAQVDSNKVCAPGQPKNSIKAINPKPDTSKIYNRGPK